MYGFQRNTKSRLYHKVENGSRRPIKTSASVIHDYVGLIQNYRFISSFHMKIQAFNAFDNINQKAGNIERKDI